MPAPDQANIHPTSAGGPSTTTDEDDIRLAQESLNNDIHQEPEEAAHSSSPTSDPSHPEAYDTDPSSDGEDENAIQSAAHSPTSTRRYSLSNSYQRPSYIAQGGSRSTVVPSYQGTDGAHLSESERRDAHKQERKLLEDSKIIPKQPRQRRPSTSSGDGIINSLKRSFTGQSTASKTPVGGDPTETTPLLQALDLPINDENDNESEGAINSKWDEALAAGKIHTTWRRELKVLFRSSRSLVIAFLLQYSLPVTSIFMVGHLGKDALGAVSLGSMTCTITGYAIYIGLATSLDTLCAQAYGSGHKKLVGLQMQRMIAFLWVCTIPIGIVWLCGTWILQAIVPHEEREIAAMAGLYLKVALIGAPFYAAWESGKRFLQAQGLFSGVLFVLALCAPLNVLLQYLLVFKADLGFVGAPIGLVIAEIMMPISMLVYVRFVGGRDCWGGLSKQAFSNWWPMIRLALPGMAMVLAEFLCFEILAFAASWMSSLHLATNSILMSTCAAIYQIPFPISVASSNRIANLIGATLVGPAKTAAKVSATVACVVGVFDMAVIAGLHRVIPSLMTSEPDVIELASKVLFVCAAFQFFDATAAFCNGVLRGLGKQEFGGYVALICYYGVGMPISFGTGFGLDWQLYGLWAGPAVALALTVAANGIYILRTDWDKCVEAAQSRNSGAV